MKHRRPVRILVTGFGRFPHVRINPTERVAQSLAARQQFHRMGIEMIAHVFPTRWTILADEVERVIKKAGADAVLHLGVAARRKYIAIETVARLGSRRLLPDAGGKSDNHASPAGVTHLRIAAPAEPLRVAIARGNAPVRLSNNAGRYLCNGLYGRSLQLRAAKSEKRATLFIHVPMPSAKSGTVPKARKKSRRISLKALTDAIGAAIPVLAIHARRGMKVSMA